MTFIFGEHHSFGLKTKYTFSGDGFYISFQESQSYLGCRHMCSAMELPYHLFYTPCIHGQISREHVSSLISHIKQISCEVRQCDRALCSPPYSLSPSNSCFSLILSVSHTSNLVFLIPHTQPLTVTTPETRNSPLFRGVAQFRSLTSCLNPAAPGQASRQLFSSTAFDLCVCVCVYD